MDDASMERIMEAIRNDPDLGEDFVTCYKDNSDTFSKGIWKKIIQFSNDWLNKLDQQTIYFKS